MRDFYGDAGDGKEFVAMYDDIQISSEFELQYMYENESHSRIVEVLIVIVE